MTATGAVWRNWARSQKARPKRIERPNDAEAVERAVRAAATRGLRIKPVGAGMSFSAIAVAPTTQLDLHRLSGLVSVDETARQATILAGTPIHRVADLLGEHGLALPTIGDIDRETLGGALSIGSHGTGDRWGGISSRVVALTLVDGTGTTRRLAQGDPDLLAARLGLGALGVIVDATLQCVPAFALHAVERTERIDDVLASYLERAASVDHLQFLWFPDSSSALTECYERMPADAALHPRPAVQRFVDDELLANGVLGAVCGIATVVPGIVAPFNRLTGRLVRPRDYTEASSDVFPERRRVRFRELEYAIPRAALPDTLRELRSLLERRGWRIPFPVLARTGAAETSWLSPAFERETAWIGVHQYRRIDPHPFFAEAERIFLDAVGRPNWAMMHTLDADRLRTLYPRFDDVLAVRDRLDPERLFANAYLRQVLGD